MWSREWWRRARSRPTAGLNFMRFCLRSVTPLSLGQNGQSRYVQFSTYRRPIALDRPRHARVQHLNIECRVGVGLGGSPASLFFAVLAGGEGQGRVDVRVEARPEGTEPGRNVTW